jgi:hypothetical protein
MEPPFLSPIGINGRLTLVGKLLWLLLSVLGVPRSGILMSRIAAITSLEYRTSYSCFDAKANISRAYNSY